MALERLERARRRTLALLGDLTPEQLTRSGRHPVRGQVTIEDELAHVLLHDRKHRRQIERVKRALAEVS